MTILREWFHDYFYAFDIGITSCHSLHISIPRAVAGGDGMIIRNESHV